MNLFLLLWACLLVLGTEAHAAAVATPKRILILNSYHHGYKGSDDIVEGFTETVAKSFPDNETIIEYLDTKHYSGKEFDRKILELLRFKYQGRHFDLVFSTDDYAFDVVEQHREELFGTIPVVFCGTNSFDSSRLAGKRGIVGIDERPSFRDTLEVIFKIHPACKNVVVIRDDSLTGRLNGAEFQKAAETFRTRATFSYHAGMLLEDAVELVKHPQPDTVFVYFCSFVQNRAGDRISSGESLRLISAASQAPIYGGWEFNLGNGVVGGRLVNLHQHGAAAASMAVQILNGASPDTLPRVSPSPNQYMFDYAQMSRFRILESQLPQGSVIINKPPGFIYLHRVEILALLSGILLVALAAIFMKLLHSRQNLKVHRDALSRRNDELEDALSKVKLLEGIIPICMYCKKISNDKESWQLLETYITQHSEAQFSHGICPDCFEKMKMDVAALGQARTSTT
jgi:ABC-type uncharacterized transport system substrate-binding protein